MTLSSPRLMIRFSLTMIYKLTNALGKMNIISRGITLKRRRVGGPGEGSLCLGSHVCVCVCVSGIMRVRGSEGIQGAPKGARKRNRKGFQVRARTDVTREVPGLGRHFDECVVRGAEESEESDELAIEREPSLLVGILG